MIAVRWVFGVLVALFLAARFVAPAGYAAAREEIVFPFVKGTTWAYAGTVRWTTGSNHAETRSVRWTSTVVDAFDRGDVAGALLHGGVWDLAWWTPSSHPADYAVLRSGARYHLVRDDARRAFAAAKRAAVRMSPERDAWFDVPLRPGALLRPKDVASRADSRYGWLVAAASTHRPGYILTYTTLPDQERVTLVPGVGVTSFVYRHHGTVAEADVRLVDVRLAGRRPAR